MGRQCSGTKLGFASAALRLGLSTGMPRLGSPLPRTLPIHQTFRKHTGTQNVRNDPCNGFLPTYSNHTVWHQVLRFAVSPLDSISNRVFQLLKSHFNPYTHCPLAHQRQLQATIMQLALSSCSRWTPFLMLYAQRIYPSAHRTIVATA